MNRIIHFLSTSRTALILLLATLLTATTAQTAWADGVSYRYYDTSDKTFKTGTVPDGATVVTTTEAYVVSTWGTDGTETWYVIQGSVTRNYQIELKGTVNVVLCDGATLTVKNGLQLKSSNSTLNIFAQTDGTGMGEIVAQGTETYRPGIGVYYSSSIDGSTCTVNIHGGKISATGGQFTAGIGGASGNCGGTINIYGGDITAQGGQKAAGIGSGYPPSSGKSLQAINIYGGKVNATGGDCGAGIGGGGSTSQNNIKGGPINIYGGQITATAGAQSGEAQALPMGIGKGGGYYHSGYDVFLSWTDADNDFIEATRYGYGGTVTLDSDHPFKLAGTETEATTSNIGGKKIVPAQATVYTVTFDTGGGTAVASQGIVKGQTATEPGRPVRQGYRFQKWQLSGSDYNFSTAVTADITLTAVWAALPATTYRNASNEETALAGEDYWPLEPSVTTLNGGTWVVMDNATTFAERITIVGNVTLILADGKTLTAQKGISVTEHDNAVLTILAQSGGTGALTVTGVNDQDDASIGGDDASDRYNCGTVSIYGGRITISGNYSGAGIGGAGGYGAGGTINILGGQVDVSGSMLGGHAIGYGYNSNKATATITLGWRNATDYICLHNNGSVTACCKGTVTIASNFLLYGTSTKARWTSESDNNIDGKKLVPDEQGLMDWADVKLALEAGETVTLTNDVSSESGDNEIRILENVNATLDLNGHTLRHGNATTSGHEQVIQVQPNATLTIQSTSSAGRIAGNLAGIYNQGTVSITNVNFSGFGGTDGNKYAITNDGGTLSLTDVSITGNTGGGIYIYNNGTLNVAGKVNITDNTRMLSADAISYNVYLESGAVITLTGALTSDSRIGVSGVSNRAITSGAAGRATLANFTRDGLSYICWTTDGSEIQINQEYYMNEKDGVTDLVSRYAGQLVAVRFARSFTSGVASTICLPFNMNAELYKDYGTFYKFVGVEKVADDWTLTMQEATNKMSAKLDANTPYLFMPKQTGTVTFDEPLTVPASGGFTTVDVTPDASQYPNATGWTYRGTYNYMKWTTDTSDPDYNAERAAEIGKAYGFAGVAKTGINVGDFVRVASGAKIRPMRCYLLWSDTPSNARTLNRGAAAEEELPQRITVRLVGLDGETTAIGTLDTKTGEFDFDPDGWYDMSGRRLSGKPSQKGVYINNGKKVIVK